MSNSQFSIKIVFNQKMILFECFLEFFGKKRAKTVIFWTFLDNDSVCGQWFLCLTSIPLFDIAYQRHVSMAKVQSWWRGTACRFRLMASRLDFMPGSLLQRWVRHARLTCYCRYLTTPSNMLISLDFSRFSHTGAFVSWGGGVEANGFGCFNCPTKHQAGNHRHRRKRTERP